MEINPEDKLDPFIQENSTKEYSSDWREENFLDPQNQSNKKVLNDLYGEEIFSIIEKLESLKENSNSYLKRIKEELNIKYETFNNNMLKYINIATNKVINVFQIDFSNINGEKSKIIKEFSSEKIILLNKIISLHNQILEVIQQNFLILQNFLKIFEFLDKEKPIQQFFNKEFDNILKSWLFLKIDLEKFNYKKIIKKSNLTKNYNEFITNECQEKNSVMNIEIPESFQEDINKSNYKMDNEIKMISENISHLVKLNVTNIPNIDDIIGTYNFDKLEKFKLINSNFTNNNIFKQLPSLNKLQIKFCPLFNIELLSNINQIHLKSLILNKNGFVNQDIDYLFSNYIIKSPNLLNSLELLSLSSNSISKIDFSCYLTMSKHTFRSLKTLDLSKNEIYKIIINKVFFPNLKLIDCCNNNLSNNFFTDLDQDNSIIILQSGNLFLLEDELCNEYYTNLKNKLNKISSFSFKKLNLSFCPTAFGQAFFKEVNINCLLLFKLKKLNLSYNGLNCSTFFTFMEKNKECVNLHSLNLIGNNLDDTFFEKYLNLGFNRIFPYLQNLYLNDNKIGGDSDIIYTDDYPISIEEKKKDILKLRLMYKFITQNKNLKILTITKNPISKKYKIKYEENENCENNDEYIKRDDNGNIIINGFFSFLVKIKNELLDREDYTKDSKGFNIGFDCCYDVNLNSDNYPYDNQPIVFK